MYNGNSGFQPQADVLRHQETSMSPASSIRISLEINGRDHEFSATACDTLLDVLRDKLGMTGTKKGCDMGACGACTVLADGRRIKSCLALAASCDGRSITTIEGIGDSGQATSAAGRLYSTRCTAMRLLHAGADHVRHWRCLMKSPRISKRSARA